MDTKKIREFAIEQHKKNHTEESLWVKYSDDWDIEIFLPEWDEKIASCVVHPVIDGQVEPSWGIYEFDIPRVPQLGSLVDDAINIAVEHIQNGLGITDGGFASLYFDGNSHDALKALLHGYAKAELAMQKLGEEI